MNAFKPLPPDNASYFRARALQEQVAAQKATCGAARQRHDELAIMYRFRAIMLSGEPISLQRSPCALD
jgi:hypothetical protein